VSTIVHWRAAILTTPDYFGSNGVVVRTVTRVTLSDDFAPHVGKLEADMVLFLSIGLIFNSISFNYLTDTSVRSRCKQSTSFSIAIYVKFHSNPANRKYLFLHPKLDSKIALLSNPLLIMFSSHLSRNGKK